MICNMDCFHCKHPDCVRDEKQDTNDRVSQWRKSHPDQVKAIRRSQYIKNRDKEIAYHSERYKAVKDTEEYKVSRKLYMREYRARKKAERVS